MDQPTFDPPQRASRAAARRVGARAVRLASRMASQLASGSALCLLAGALLLPPAAQAQDAGGPIVIPGPGEKNPAALADLAAHLQDTPAKRVGSAATLAAATAQSLTPGTVARNTDSFTRAANASGSIVIPGMGEPPAAPQMIRTNFKPDANGVVTIPAPGSAGPAANGAVNSAASIAASAPATDGFDSLASRGEPPQLGANGTPVVSKGTVAIATVAAPAPSAAPTPATIGRISATRAAAPAVAQQNLRPAAVAQPAPLPGQQDPEAIRSAALAFLQQQSTGLPGKVDISVAPAFPRGLAACATLAPFMPTGARLWGRTTVGVRCAGERPWTIYLQARISLHATYYLAARAMAPGEVLTAADLVARDGDLTGLPQAIVTDPAQAVGSVTLTRVAGGMPLRRDMLKSASAVSIGQTVRVVAAGDGFAISAEGSALNNASPGQQVRVKTANGQIISGIVKDGATVEIQL
ncbi:flagella basal body P-ring formation protein FlgA [Paraburkholderia ginsengiterrae]|uniref:Flagella basal body P-ring formation protein FlgA n=1 Tax=Paraburkholderia ginsengiterrae TaxID=1462993 RepID=A0A1A9NCC0_9BURK|nr:flagellar basal body P-ring formation chaperone FlgA [Paraburkholderia ginsengiterrae]OAJ60708.1 flagella basal body P-ring formation protein FlgA [Paraburkholderia ginsengiterrae]OAJ64266.1 flagella basal body P-ring formation protein FlgA [Paraburkholderia ginsengiterrae]